MGEAQLMNATGPTEEKNTSASNGSAQASPSDVEDVVTKGEI
jgi:hypothetical protein